MPAVPPPVSSGMAPAATRPPRLWPWVVLLVIGVLLIPTGVAVYVAKTVQPLLSHTSQQTPTTITETLSTGTYYLFEDSTALNAGVPTVQPSDVTVRSPDGGVAVQVSAPSLVQTLGANGTSYVGVISFTVLHQGMFNVHVRSPLGVPVDVFVAPGILSTLGRNVGWLGLTGLGGLLFVVGLVLLIVRGVQRSRRKQTPQFAPRCANGHPASPQDRFCHVCGAPVYAAAPTMAPPR